MLAGITDEIGWFGLIAERASPACEPVVGYKSRSNHSSGPDHCLSRHLAKTIAPVGGTTVRINIIVYFPDNMIEMKLNENELHPTAQFLPRENGVLPPSV